MDDDGGLVVVGTCDAEGRLGEETEALLEVAQDLRRGAQGRPLVVAISRCATPRDDVSPVQGVGRSVSSGPPGDDGPRPEVLALALVELLALRNATLVVLDDDQRSRELAAALAALLGVPCATGCREMSWIDGRLTFKRDLYGGAVTGQFVVAEPAIITTVPPTLHDSSTLEAESRGCEVIELAAPTPEDSLRVLERSRFEASGSALERSKRIVSGGRGIGGSDGFRRLADLAERIGAQLAGSRPPCDLGWIPSSRMVGITGRTVKPDLYLAVGISGSAQHRFGMSEAKVVVAINNDGDAEIFRYADYGVTGDWREVIAGMLAVLDADSSVRGESH